MSYAECFRNKWPNFGIVFYTIPQFGHLFLNTLYIRVTCVRVCDCVVACNCAIVCVQSRKCAWQWNETKLLIQFKGKTVKNSFSCTVRHLSIALRILLESLPKNVWRIGIRILIKYLRIKMFTSFFFFCMLWQSCTILTLSIEFLWCRLNLACFDQRRLYGVYAFLHNFSAFFI